MKIIFRCCINSVLIPLGGARNSKIVSADASFFTVPDLKESATYNIYVSSMIGNREGSSVLLTAKTCELTSDIH